MRIFSSRIYFFLHCTCHFHPEMSTKMVIHSGTNSVRFQKKSLYYVVDCKPTSKEIAFFNFN